MMRILYLFIIKIISSHNNKLKKRVTIQGNSLQFIAWTDNKLISD